MHEVNDVIQTEIHTAESTVTEPSVFEVEELKHYKSPNIDQITSELMKAGSRTIHYEIHKHILSLCNMEELPEEWKESIIVPMYKKGHKTDCSNYRSTSLLPPKYKILSYILLSKLTPYAGGIIDPPYRRPFLHPQPEDAPCRGDRERLITWFFLILPYTLHHV